MPKYQIILNFETEDELPENILGEVEANCFVQLESLCDGDLEGQEERYSIKTSSSESKKL
jgi:hypothetical protein